MNNRLKKRNEIRKKRVLRVRKKLKGTKEKPRLSVSKTKSHLYVQFINDEESKTIFGMGTLGLKLKKSKESAKKLGKKIAEEAKNKGIEKVIFDRGRFKFHGIIAELALAARDVGLQF